jgi:hypothetical protein
MHTAIPQPLHQNVYDEDVLSHWPTRKTHPALFVRFSTAMHSLCFDLFLMPSDSRPFLTQSKTATMYREGRGRPTAPIHVTALGRHMLYHRAVPIVKGIPVSAG